MVNSIFNLSWNSTWYINLQIQKIKIGPSGDMCLWVTNVTPWTLSVWLLTCFCNWNWQLMLVMLLNPLVWKQDGRGFVECQCSVRQGMQGYEGKFFVTLAVVVCQQEKYVHIGSALKNVVRAGLVFDVVLYLPSTSRLRCLIDTEI